MLSYEEYFDNLPEGAEALSEAEYNEAIGDSNGVR
ncbi:gp1 [Shigella phage Buco]|uniref:Uncharacterized protein n=1 Tax=Shigella phage Buco TaxID=2530183 RepID=A0A482JGM9_9CAUD|nr:gp1 [Shigella phage Buco]QBP32901.1 hypothetical protein HRP29_gp1 [Shigella phage Buco]